MGNPYLLLVHEKLTSVLGPWVADYFTRSPEKSRLGSALRMHSYAAGMGEPQPFGPNVALQVSPLSGPWDCSAPSLSAFALLDFALELPQCLLLA